MTVVNDISFRHVGDLPGVNHPALKSLETYWRALRHSSHIPSLSITPRAPGTWPFARSRRR